MTREEFLIEQEKIGDRWITQLKTILKDQTATGEYEINGQMWHEACEQFGQANSALVAQLSAEDVAHFYPDGYPPPEEKVDFVDVLIAHTKKESGRLN
jgi:hypothetical protein